MYDFAVDQRPANPLLTDGAESLSPAIGPTLGTNFVVVGFEPPLQTGGPLCAGPTAVYRDKQVDLIVNSQFIVLDQGMVPRKLSISALKEALQK